MAAKVNCKNGFCSDWGTVVLLVNRNRLKNNFIETQWAEFMSPKIKNEWLTAKLKSEKSSIDVNGFLTIKWPIEVTRENKIETLDFLIATVTEPTLIKGRYPTAYQIAAAMKKAKYYQYFIENEKSKISTFQDDRIRKLINK